MSMFQHLAYQLLVISHAVWQQIIFKESGQWDSKQESIQ